MVPLTASPRLRHRVLVLAWMALLLAPIIYIAGQSAAASRNFPFWDELDSAIDFVVKLSAGESWRDALSQFFALSNEHRTVTSRIIFAISYWTTGTVNFHVIGIIGNLFIVGACALLVAAVRGPERRIRMAVVLALLVFQLEHFENFIWSGASIDHFQVVMLAVAAIVLLARDTAGSTAGAACFAMLATFTLAHGCVVWALGALWLAHRRSWARLGAWGGAAAVTLFVFFAGFTFNPGHNVPTLTPAALVSIGHFWLQLIGSPITLGQRAYAAIPGAVLLAILAILVRRGALTKQPVAALTALFGVASLVLVAFGRVNTGIETITSRYMILAALPWAMVLVMLLEEAATPEHPYRWLAYATPGLLALNITADITFQVPKEAFIEVRDRAATYFKGHGHVGTGISRMHPQPTHAEEILAAAYARGVYHLARVSNPVEFTHVEPSKRMITYVDELVTTDRAVTIGGWAMLPGHVSKRGQVYLVLQTENAFLTYTTLTLQRPDVAKAYKEPKWRLCGFRAVIGRDRLPAKDFRVGVLIVDHGKAEYLLTDNRLALAPTIAAKEQLASAQ